MDKFKNNMDIVMVKVFDNIFIVLELVINIDNMLDICFWFYSSNCDLMLYRMIIYKCVVEFVCWID